MLKKTEIALRAARIAALAVVVGVTGGLAGCDNDDNGSGDGTGGGGGGGGTNNGGKAVDFSGANGPAVAVSQALSLSSLASQVAAAASDVTPKAASNPCTEGGSLTERAASTGTNANVPFADAASAQYDLGGADFAKCIITSQVSNQGGIDSDTKISIDGPITTGAATGFAFASIGDSPDKMLNYIVDIKTSGSFNGQSFNATSKVTLGQFYRFDLKSISGGSEQQLFSIFKFAASSTGSSGGQTGSGGATGLVQYGKSLSDRFKFVSDANGFTMNGSYKYDLTTCSGEVAVKTNTPLTTSGGAFDGGQIELTTGGKSLTVTYEGTNLIVNKGQADERAFTQQEAAQAASSNVCAGALGLTPAAALAYLP